MSQRLCFANGNILVGARCQVNMKVPIQNCRNFCSFEAMLLVFGREQVKRLEIYSFLYNILLVLVLVFMDYNFSIKMWLDRLRKRLGIELSCITFGLSPTHDDISNGLILLDNDGFFTF